MITRRRLFALAAAAPAVPIAAMLPKVEALGIWAYYFPPPMREFVFARRTPTLGEWLAKHEAEVDFNHDEIADDYPPMA